LNPTKVWNCPIIFLCPSANLSHSYFIQEGSSSNALQKHVIGLPLGYGSNYSIQWMGMLHKSVLKQNNEQNHSSLTQWFTTNMASVALVCYQIWCSNKEYRGNTSITHQLKTHFTGKSWNIYTWKDSFHSSQGLFCRLLRNRGKLETTDCFMHMKPSVTWKLNKYTYLHILWSHTTFTKCTIFWSQA